MPEGAPASSKSLVSEGDASTSSKEREKKEKPKTASKSNRGTGAIDAATWSQKTQSNLNNVRAIREAALAKLNNGTVVTTDSVLGSSHNYSVAQDRLKRRTAEMEGISTKVADKIESSEQWTLGFRYEWLSLHVLLKPGLRDGIPCPYFLESNSQKLLQTKLGVNECLQISLL